MAIRRRRRAAALAAAPRLASSSSASLSCSRSSAPSWPSTRAASSALPKSLPIRRRFRPYSPPRAEVGLHRVSLATHAPTSGPRRRPRSRRRTWRSGRRRASPPPPPGTGGAGRACRRSRATRTSRSGEAKDCPYRPATAGRRRRRRRRRRLDRGLRRLPRRRPLRRPLRRRRRRPRLCGGGLLDRLVPPGGRGRWSGSCRRARRPGGSPPAPSPLVQCRVPPPRAPRPARPAPAPRRCRRCGSRGGAVERLRLILASSGVALRARHDHRAEIGRADAAVGPRTLTVRAAARPLARLQHCHDVAEHVQLPRDGSRTPAPMTMTRFLGDARRRLLLLLPPQLRLLLPRSLAEAGRWRAQQRWSSSTPR